MYKSFFGLTRNPFELSPDPSFICPSEKHSEALSLISYAISQRKGFMVLTGEVGTGKTLMLRCLFESWRREGIAFANIFAPKLSVMDFLTYAAADLGIETAEPTKGDLLRAFYAFVSAQRAKGLTTVLVIDEAHHATTQVLEEIRMLTNIETNQEKLVQVLLVGQPELDDKLDTFELRQLKQRIAVRCQLEPLGEEETRQYIEQRLKIAGADPGVRQIFPAESIRHIYQCSRGIPRIVNSICDQALIAACAQRIHDVPVEIVDEVALRFRFAPGGALKEAGAGGTLVPAPTAVGELGNVAGKNGNDVLSEPGRQGSERPAVVVAAFWRTWPERWPALLRRVAVVAAAAAVLLGVSLGGFALFRRTSNTVAYGAASAPPAVVAERPESLPADAAVVPAPLPVKSAPPAAPVETVATAPAAAPAPKAAQPESESVRPQSNPIWIKTEHRPTVEPGNFSKPIANTRSLSTSSGSAPILGAPENLSPRVDIGSLDATLTAPATPLGGHLKEPVLISSTPPIYPATERSLGVEGVVVIDALVDATGKVKQMKLISGPTAFVQPAMDALRKWKYEPARLNDQPIDVHANVRVNFSIH
jgi:general secretion pathway protein A